MQLKNTKENFGLVAKFFHWTIAILIFLALSAGFYMIGLEMSPFKLTVYMTHKSIGIAILILVAGRISWRIVSPRPDELPTYKDWEVILSKSVHFALYLCMVVMPATGWLMSSAGGFPATFFNLFSLPPLMDKNPQIFAITRDIHEFTAYAILFLLPLHFGGAFKHHFIDRDVTLKRMTSYKVGIWWGLLFVAVAAVFWIKPVSLAIGDEKREAAREAAEEVSKNTVPGETTSPVTEGWTIDLQNSSIQFEATQYGERFNGKFTSFGGKILFDPQKLDKAYADIWIDIASIDTGSADRDSQAKSAEWFDTANFPKAQFVADSFSETSAGHYVAHGALTIRGKAAMVDLPFTLQIRESPEGQAALMEGHVDLNRLDFGIGQGQWQSTDTIGGTVRMNITVLATQ